MRLLPLVLAVVLLAAGWGGNTHSAPPAQGTLAAALSRPGPEISLVQGTSDYAVGPVRVTFLFIDSHSKSIERSRARVWVGTRLDAPTVLTTEATLEPIGVPGVSAAATGDVSRIYVARFRLTRPGKYTLVAEPEGEKIQGVATIQVAERPKAPAVGDRAIPSHTPTLATAHGDVSTLTTKRPPDRTLLGYSVAGSLAAHAPFVLVFATPKFCTSRTCGPVVDVAQAVQSQFKGRGVRFIHVEIYQDNNPAQGANRWVKEWRLPSEPFVFLVGRDGRIKGRFEGSVSVAELAAAVRSTLL